MKIEERIKTEKRLVRHLIRVMKLAGWEVAFVDDGGENVKCVNESEVLEAVFSVDESKIVFEKDKIRHYAYIVLGNDGYDAIADYTYRENDDFEKTMETVMEYANYLETEY